jgi:Arc/MetJ family transcription regulator
MPTNLNLNDHLVAEAKELGGHRTKRDAVNQALEDYVNRKKRLKLVELFGKTDWDPSYDHKALRQKR